MNVDALIADMTTEANFTRGSASETVATIPCAGGNVDLCCRTSLAQLGHEGGQYQHYAVYGPDGTCYVKHTALDADAFANCGYPSPGYNYVHWTSGPPSVTLSAPAAAAMHCPRPEDVEWAPLPGWPGKNYQSIVGVSSTSTQDNYVSCAAHCNNADNFNGQYQNLPRPASIFLPATSEPWCEQGGPEERCDYFGIGMTPSNPTRTENCLCLFQNNGSTTPIFGWLNTDWHCHKDGWTPLPATPGAPPPTYATYTVVTSDAQAFPAAGRGTYAHALDAPCTGSNADAVDNIGRSADFCPGFDKAGVAPFNFKTSDGTAYDAAWCCGIDSPDICNRDGQSGSDWAALEENSREIERARSPLSHQDIPWSVEYGHGCPGLFPSASTTLCVRELPR